jgi:hypothetical protein
MRRYPTGAALRCAPLGLILLAALQLAACSISLPVSSGTPIPTPPALACADHQQVQLDTISHEITCIINGAPASQTGFWLYYMLADQQGHERTFQGTCQGTLTQRRGACTETYAELVGQFDHPTATITGILLPSQQALGPVTPSVISS